MRKTGIRLGVALLLVILAFSLAVVSFADTAKNPLAIDMVIVIENSTRMSDATDKMRKLDGGGLRFDAAAALISMCDAQYSRASYFLFNNDLYLYSETDTGNVKNVTTGDIPLFDISLPAHKPQRQRLMEILNGDKIRSGYGTKPGVDIGKAFSAAVDVQMREKGNGNRKVILLLTSGNNKLSKESLQMAYSAREKAIGNGIEVYAVALTDTSSSQLLQELVTKSDNYQFASSPEDLVDVYRNFFASMIGSDPMESKSVRLGNDKSQILLDIPNDSVAEVNIILPLKRVDDLVLTDPDGKVINRTEDNVMVSKSTNFISYKLISPKSSTYQLSYTSADERNIVVQYVFSYGVQVQARVNAEKINKHEPVTITAQYVVDGIPSKDTKLYNIPATITLRKDGEVISASGMEQKANEYSLTFSDLEQYGAGVYSVDIHFEGDGLRRDSETLTFELINNPPQLVSSSVKGDNLLATINVPKEPDSYKPEKNIHQWDLNSFVQDVNGDVLTPEITSNTADVEATLDGMMLTVKPLKDTSTEGDIHIIVKDEDEGVSPELVFHVVITNYENRYDSYGASFDALHGIEKNSTCDITLRVYDEAGNEIRDDEQLPDEITAKIAEPGFQPFDVSLSRDGNVWKGSFQTGKKETTYTLNAAIPVGQKNITAKTAEVLSVNKAPELVSSAVNGDEFHVTVNIPKEIDSYDPEKNLRVWDLAEYVKDHNGDELSAEIVSNTSETDATLNGLKLVVKPLRNTATDGQVKVVIMDNDGAKSPELDFHVTVENFENKYDTYTAHFDPVKKIEKNKECTLTLRLYDAQGNEVRGDEQVPDSIIASVAEPGAQPVDLTMTKDGNRWTGIFQTGEVITEYTVSAEIPVGQKTIEADRFILSSENKIPTLRNGAKVNYAWNVTINEPSDAESYKVQQMSWNLSDVVEDLDGDRLKFTIDKDSTTAAVNAAVNDTDQVLTISTRLNTETDGDVVVHCQDNDGAAGPVLTFHVKVVSNEEKYKLYTAKLEADGRGKSKDITITLSVMDEKGMLVTGDENLEDTFDASYTLGNVQTPLQMTRGEDGKWTGKFRTTDTEETYTIAAAVRISENVNIVAPELTLNTANTAPHVTKELNAENNIPETIQIEPFLIWNKATGDIVISDLNEYFADADGDKLSYSVDAQFAANQAEAIVEGNQLTIRGLGETSGNVSFTVIATDNENEKAVSAPISFKVKSLQKQGIITLVVIAVAIILLLIIIQAAKPKYPSGAFSVSVNGVPFDKGNPLPKGSMAKKAVKLQSYAPSMAKAEYGNEINTSLGKVIMKPARGKSVSIDASKADGINVKLEGKDQRKGTLKDNGKLTVSKGDKTVVFELKLNGINTKKNSNNGSSKETTSSTVAQTGNDKKHAHHTWG